MIWASGRHGSKRAPAMIKPISWSLPISGSVPGVFSAVTVTFLPTGISLSGADSIIAAETSLATMVGSRVSGWSRVCFSAQILRRPIQLPTWRLLHFMSACSVPSSITGGVSSMGPCKAWTGTTPPITSPPSHQICRQETVKCTTVRSHATCAINT